MILENYIRINPNDLVDLYYDSGGI